MDYLHNEIKIKVGEILICINPKHEKFLEIGMVIDADYCPSPFGGHSHIVIKFKDGSVYENKEFEIEKMFKKVTVEEI